MQHPALPAAAQGADAQQNGGQQEDKDGMVQQGKPSGGVGDRLEKERDSQRNAAANADDGLDALFKDLGRAHQAPAGPALVLLKLGPEILDLSILQRRVIHGEHFPNEKDVLSVEQVIQQRILPLAEQGLEDLEQSDDGHRNRCPGPEGRCLPCPGQFAENPGGAVHSGVGAERRRQAVEEQGREVSGTDAVQQPNGPQLLL